MTINIPQNADKDVKQWFEMKRLLANRNAGIRIEDEDGKLSYFLEEVGADGKDRVEFMGHSTLGVINRLKAMQDVELKRAKATIQKHARNS